MKITEHIEREEIECKCGCGFADISPVITGIFEEIRALCSKINAKDTPIRIASGCRCQEHNKAVGGASKSYHLKGMALDLVPPVGFRYNGFVEICEKIVGDKGAVIGYYAKTIVHIDCRGIPIRTKL